MHDLAQHFPLIHDNNIMERDQTKLVTRCEIKKDRVAYYPFYIISGTYSTPDLSFIIAADYSSDNAVLYVYPLRNDMNKLITSTIQLTDIMPHKVIATIHVTSLVVRPASSSVSIQTAQFILGYRSGQIIVVEYKDKECKVKHRFNKTLKNQSFFSRASSAIFGGEDTYASQIKGPIRHFSIHPELPECAYVWQAGNNIVLQKELNQNRENRFFNRVESLELENYHLNYDVNKLVKESDVYLYGCEYYTMVEHPQLASAMLVFKDDISSFVILGARRELVVSLSSKEIVLIIDMTHFLLKGMIRPEMPVRKLTSFTHRDQPYLAMLPYENYIIIYSLANNTYCKLRGHKSFISNVAYSQKGEKLISAGMDHQICIIKLDSITEGSWLSAEQGEKWRIVKEYGVPDQKFQDIYKLGESGSSSNSIGTNRTNAYSYGFAEIFPLSGHFCFPTYDCRIIIYSL